MLIKVDPASSVPVYAQIVSQVKHAVAAGLLRPGDYLPSLRDASLVLRVNPNTVAKAYRELETHGVIRTDHGRGSVITDNGSDATTAYRTAELARLAGQLAVEGYHLGASPAQIAAALQSALSALKPQFESRDAGQETPHE
ncbi:MAG TPA: GntR family transcriptional regulator [Armatimonadota bacterium]|jgi:GntR family transcriptional regulator